MRLDFRSNLVFLKSLFLINLKANSSNRGAFLFQMVFMFINNFSLFLMWWIFFQRFPNLRGWSLSDVAMLYGIVSGGCGWVAVVTGGFIHLARTIHDGNLDGFLTQPKNTLLYSLCSSSPISGWGDILSSVLFLGFFGSFSIFKLLFIFLLIFCSGLIFLSSAILIHSFVFWIPSIEGVARQLVDFLSVLSINPQSAFSGFLKILLFSLVPAGFVGYIPVELIREFTWESFLLLILSAMIYMFLAYFVFHRGLSRYESGNQIGVRV